ncbi:MAG: transposase, partial [Desulfobacula sp.]|nr:transposase [Desulfobacula sp.]
MKSLNGNFELQTPRDRNGTFSPQLVKIHQTTLSNEIGQKIIALYGPGMSYNNIAAHVQEMYGLKLSTGTLPDIDQAVKGSTDPARRLGTLIISMCLYLLSPPLR